MAANFPGSLMQPREDIGGASGELGGIGGLAKNAMYERWWRKELEDFDRVAVPKMKEAVTKLGELANDENFTDHGGAWAMMKSAVSAVQSEALKYPNNPYIAKKHANMTKALSGSFQEMTQGLKDMQGIRTAREQQETAKFKRTDVMPAQILASKAQTKAAEAQLKQAERGKARRTNFGDLRGHAIGWASTVEGSPLYAKLYADRELDSANKAWEGDDGQAYRDRLGVMATQQDFRDLHSLDDKEKQQFKKEMFTAAVAQLGESPEVAASFVNDMIRSSPVRQAVDDAKKPVVLKTAIKAGTPALNRLFWNDPAMGEGSAADFSPVMLKKHRNSIGGKVKAMYARLRLPPNSLSHQEAKDQIFETGTVDIAVKQFLDIDNRAGQVTLSEIVKEVTDMLDAEDENFMFTREEERRKRLLEEGAYGGVAEKMGDIIGEMSNAPDIAVSIWRAGMGVIFGKEIDPAAAEYLQRAQANMAAKGQTAKPGASPAPTVPPRLIDSE